MTSQEFLDSLNEVKMVLTSQQYSFLMGEKAKLTAIEVKAREGTLTSEYALRVIEKGASKEDFA